MILFFSLILPLTIILSELLHPTDAKYNILWNRCDFKPDVPYMAVMGIIAAMVGLIVDWFIWGI